MNRNKKISIVMATLMTVQAAIHPITVLANEVEPEQEEIVEEKPEVEESKPELTTEDNQEETKEQGNKEKEFFSTEETKNSEESVNEESVVIEKETESQDSVAPQATTHLLSKAKFHQYLIDSQDLTALRFVASEVPAGVNVANQTDLSENGDRSVIGYKDGTTGIITSGVTGQSIELPADSSCLIGYQYGDPISGFIEKLTSINFEAIDTSNVTEMNGMFRQCSNLTTLDVSNFNTSNVTSMKDMFFYCTSLTTLDVSNFNTSNVTNMWGMFQVCSNLKTLDLSNFNTSNVTIMDVMFASCSSLTTVDLSGFNTSNVEGIMSMFTLCSSLKTIYSKAWNIEKLGPDQDMFQGCTNLVGISETGARTVYNPAEIGPDMATPENGYFTGPGVRTATVKFIDEKNTVVGTATYTLLAGEMGITEAMVQKNLPKGFQLEGPLPVMNAKTDGKTFEVRVVSIEEPWTATVKYVDANQAELGTHTFNVTSKNPDVPASEIEQYIPNGYVAKNPVSAWKVTQNNDELVVECKEKEWTSTIQYVAGGNVVGNLTVTKTGANPQISTEEIENGIPADYMKAQEITPLNITQNNQTFTVQVKAIETWTATVKYMVGGTEAGHHSFTITNKDPEITAEQIKAQVPSGYEIIGDAKGFTATQNNEEFEVEVDLKEAIWTATLKYVTADGTEAGTYEMTVSNKNPKILATDIEKNIPQGYVATDPITDQTVTQDNEVITIQVSPEEVQWTVTINYISNEKAVVGSTNFKVTNLNPVVTAAQITGAIPTGYEAAGTIADVTATQDGQTFDIQVQPVSAPVINLNATVQFVDQTGTVVGTKTFVVTDQNPVISAQELQAALPAGMTPVSPLQDLTVKQDGEVFTIEVRTEAIAEETWTITVEFKDEAGNVIGTGSFTVSSNNPVISASELSSQLPTGYKLLFDRPVTVLSESIVNGKGNIVVVVVPTGTEGPTTPKEETPNKNIGVNTSAKTLTSLYGALGLGAAGVMSSILVKKKKKK